MKRRAPLVLAALSLLLCAGPASADEATVAAAQTLFDSAIELMEKGKLAEACPRFGEAARLLPEGLGIKEQQALCHERQGLFATAWSEWKALAGLASSAKQEERARLSAEHVAALAPRLSTLTVRLAPGEAPAGLSVKRDGASIPASDLGVPVPVDGGMHEVIVAATGHPPFSRSVDVPAERGRIVVDVPPFATPPPPPVESASVRPPPPPPPPPSPGGSWQRTAGIAAIGVGGASIVVGAILGGMAIARKGQSDNGLCLPNNHCTAEGVELRSQALAFGNASTTLFVAGAALAAGGVTLFLLSPSAPPARSGAGAARGARMEVRGSFTGLSLTGHF